jgi:hypothetical protein
LTKVGTEFECRIDREAARILAQDVIGNPGNRQGLARIFLNKKAFPPDAAPAFSRRLG